MQPRFRVDFPNGLPGDRNIIAIFLRASSAYAVGVIVKKMLGKLNNRFTVTPDPE